MAYKTKYSPLHIPFEVGYPYGVVDSGYKCGWHTGVDIPQSGTGTIAPELYSVSEDGIVTYVYKNSNGSSPALGNQVQIYDNRTHLYYRYCHMLYGSVTLNVGDHVDLNTLIGRMGATGNVTGAHLHLEATTAQAWACQNFTDPCAPLGFPNIRGTEVEWDSTNPPIPPIPEGIKKSKFNWAIRNAIKRNRIY